MHRFYNKAVSVWPVIAPPRGNCLNCRVRSRSNRDAMVAGIPAKGDLLQIVSAIGPVSIRSNNSQDIEEAIGQPVL